MSIVNEIIKKIAKAILPVVNIESYIFTKLQRLIQ